MLVDLRGAAVTEYGAAPVEPTSTLLDDRATPRRVASPAAHDLAPVGAVRRPVTLPTLRARRPRAPVGVAEVRRRLHVDEL